MPTVNIDNTTARTLDDSLPGQLVNPRSRPSYGRRTELKGKDLRHHREALCRPKNRKLRKPSSVVRESSILTSEPHRPQLPHSSKRSELGCPMRRLAGSHPSPSTRRRPGITRCLRRPVCGVGPARPRRCLDRRSPGGAPADPGGPAQTRGLTKNRPTPPDAAQERTARPCRPPASRVPHTRPRPGPFPGSVKHDGLHLVDYPGR